MSIDQIASTVFGAKNDARFCDGWRDNGDSWARNYLRAAVQRGVDRIGGDAEISAANKALGI